MYGKTPVRPLSCRGPGASRLATGLTAALTAVVLLSGCSNDGGARSAWTAQPDATGTAGAQPSAVGGETTGPVTPGAQGTAQATGAATAAVWKTYTDPARRVSFDLPGDWIAQSVAPDAGTLPGALRVEVKKADGTPMATLKTGLPVMTAPQCPEAQRMPYVVLSSSPVRLPADEAAAIEPVVVFRVIQGYRYFGSYGITNVVGGADGTACSLTNVVLGPAGKGNYSFGDLETLKAFSPDEQVSPAKAFDTLDQAGKYVDDSSEYANVHRMLMSLVINT